MKPFSLCDQKVNTKIWISWEQKELLQRNKKTFFTNFQGLSVAKNSLRPETLPLTILAVKKGLFCNFTKDLKDQHFMGHSGMGLKFSITTDL